MELLFGFGDRTSDAKAEAGVLVDGDYCCNVVVIYCCIVVMIIVVVIIVVLFGQRGRRSDPSVPRV